MVRCVLYDLCKQCWDQISHGKYMYGINPSDDIDDDVCIDVYILL